MSVLTIAGPLVCPYCGNSQKQNIEVHSYTYKQVVRCDVSEGGCDGDYVVGARYRLELNYQKVEGEPV